MEELIRKLYDNTIDAVLEGIEDIYHDEVRDNYWNSLVRRYSNSLVSELVGEEMFRKVLDKKIASEVREWKTKPPGIKKNELIKDKALDQICDLSLEASSYAQNRRKNGITIPVALAEEKIRLLESLKGQEYDFNSALAETYISEGVVDYIYATGLTDNTSFRQGYF